MVWDDYRYFVALTESGTVRGAAQSLGVNASTVTRRLDILEKTLGVPLFRRSAKGMRLTPDGKDLAARVAQVADELQALERDLQGRNQRPAGKVRLALPDALGCSFLLADLVSFSAIYPDIELQLLRLTHDVMSGPEAADVALMMTDTPPEDVIGRPLGQVRLAAYASQTFLAKHGDLRTATGLTWVEWDTEDAWMARCQTARVVNFPQINKCLKCHSLLMQHASIKADAGVGILPCLVAEADATLVRLPQLSVFDGPPLWVLSQPGIRGAQRISLLLEHLQPLLIRRISDLDTIAS